MLKKVRLWLIEKLAGKDISVMLNVNIKVDTKGINIDPGQGYTIKGNSFSYVGD